MGNMNECPIDIALQYLGKKWTFHIIRDLFFGIKHFNKIKNNNDGLTSKVLSERFEELQEKGIIEKVFLNTFPVSTEYHLTEKGRALNKVLYELAVFAMNTCNEFSKIPKNNSCDIEGMRNFRKALNIED